MRNMVSIREKRRMRDYVAEHLEGGGSSIISAKGEPNHIVQDGNLVLLVDKHFGEDRFRRILTQAKGINPNFAILFYKDGKTFFRNAAHGEEAGLKGNRYKSTLGLSLKNYSQEEINRMITFRPEELLVEDARKSVIQYYQPKSEGLEEGIVTYKSEPVIFDYSHLPPQGFARGEEDSKRIRIWREKVLRDCPLKIESGYLRARKRE